VRLRGGEAARLAAFLGLTERVFVDRYTSLARDRRALTLMENADGSCVFFDGAGPACRVHAVKPAQCRSFPNGWRIPGFEHHCRAIRVPMHSGSAERVGPLK
jgi:Fe-S-cluster containining protein